MRLAVFVGVLLCCMPRRHALIQDIVDDNEVEQLQTPLDESEKDSHAQRSVLQYWLPQDFPNPSSTTKTSVCRIGRICDPDSILSSEDIDSLAALIEMFENTQSVRCRVFSERSSGPNVGSAIRVQLAIAMVKKMDLTAFRFSQDQQSKAAEFFCRSLHDTWGVGIDVPGCGGGTGIVIFLSTSDRALFISRGGALDMILTDARLDRIIEKNMKPWLRQEQYSEGLKETIHQLGVYLHKGPPSGGERIATFLTDYFVLFVIASSAMLVFRDSWKRRQAGQKYARVASQLNQLDRTRAEALQGRYRSTSCPICLEDFQVKTSAPSTSAGHDHEETTESLKCKKDSHANLRHTSPTLDSAASDMIGSDGLPLRLLRCGHVFDETCWAEWVDKGSSITRCPICQQSVGGDQNTEAPEDSNYINEGPLTDQRRARALHRYQRERYFRLTRLGSRYPEFIQPHQVHLWTQPTYNGTLSQDPTFVQRDPQLQVASSGNHTSGGRTSGFDGGRSSGGRGGRW